MVKIKQTEDELKAQLKDQIQFLINSSKAFDEGYQSEAKRLALGIRILLHDTPRMKSLLAQLNKKDILFFDTARDMFPNEVCGTSGLAQISINTSGGSYVAPLDSTPPERMNVRKPFEYWWNKTIFKTMKGDNFSRKDLITNVADQDGGAHVDSSLNKKYADFSKQGSLGIDFGMNGVDVDKIKNPVPASIRQITYEVLRTLKDEVPELF